MTTIAIATKPDHFAASGTSPTVEAALDYARRGWAVFPVHGVLPGGECACGKPACANAGKHPVTPNGHKDASTDPAQINVWFKAQPDANIAISCGQSSLFVVDVDTKNGGLENWQKLVEQHGEPQTLKARTGSGGLHYVFQAPEDPGLNKPGANKLAPGIDVRAGSSYIVAAPSLHKSGNRYEWLDSDTPIAPLPDWVRDLLTAPPSPPPVRKVAAQRTPPSPPQSFPTSSLGYDTERLAEIWRSCEGQRHELALHVSGMLAHAGLDKIGAEKLIEEICSLAGDTEVSDRRGAVQYSFSRHEFEEPITGYPTLVKAVGEELAGEVRRLLLAGDDVPFVIDRGKTYHVEPKTSERTELINAVVSIDRQSVEDDGDGGRQTVYEMSCDFRGRRLSAAISDKGFDQATSFATVFGEAGIVTAHRKLELAKNAVRTLSAREGIGRSVAYSHTGWRKIEGITGYLHGGGFLTSAGNLPYTVKLPEKLAPFTLPEPPEDARPSVRAALDLLDLHPAAMANALGCIFSSVLGATSFVSHLAGQSGVFKSQLAAIAQSFFGAGFGYDNKLAAMWADSSAIGLAALGFTLKDALLVVDDYAPTVNRAEKEKLERCINGFVRSAANGVGSTKARTDGNLRNSRPNRALVLSTGEDVPDVASIRARMFITDIRKGEVDSTKLSRAQELSRQGLFAEVMAGYLAFLAPQVERLKACAAEEVAELRRQVEIVGAHSRTPSNVAELLRGWRHFLDFAEATGEVGRAEREEFAARVKSALLSAAESAAGMVEESKPETLFLTLLQSLLDCGRAHLDKSVGRMPLDGQRGTHIGWVRDEGVYLNPAAAYAAVREFAASQGRVFPVSETTLWQRMHEAGMLAGSEKGRHTIKREKLAKSRVLWLKPELIGSAEEQVAAFPREIDLNL
jgi:hypothetical protein